MPILSADTIALRAHATDKFDAIRQAGELLVQGGRVLPEYVAGMLTREQSMSTSLGNGVAIPHGVFENRGHVLRTGISVLQLVEGVPWEDDEIVYLVIGIASSSDEHVGVLASLAEVVEDEAKLADLLQTADPKVVMDYLNAIQEPD
jgi:mannitol PTS system EIIA component